jgi:hypothetical protein
MNNPAATTPQSSTKFRDGPLALKGSDGTAARQLGPAHRPPQRRRHTVYLDQLTHALATARLGERRRRWPHTSNPYLLVSRQSAVDSTHLPVTVRVVDRCSWPLGVSPSQLRQDRILDEARHTADPVRLMRVFGICGTTAMKYPYTAPRTAVPAIAIAVGLCGVRAASTHRSSHRRAPVGIR